MKYHGAVPVDFGRRLSVHNSKLIATPVNPLVGDLQRN